MSIENTRKVMRQYWDSEHTDTSMMAKDVVFTMMANGDETRGPEAVLQMLHYFYHVAFEAHAELVTEIVSDGKAVWEGHIVGKHIGEFAGIPATGQDFRVPICIVYEVQEEHINRARIYFEIPVLLAQLGVGA
jgi:steroid delta-isomerase-like uncharacterized protein